MKAEKMASEPFVYASAKIFSGIGGMSGGFSLMAFIKPKGIWDAAIHGGVSTFSGVVFSGPILKYFEIAPNDWEFQMMAGFVIGFFSWFILSAFANFFEKNEGKDILTVAQQTKSQLGKKQATPKKRGKR
jgi:hypothetical protein